MKYSTYLAALGLTAAFLAPTAMVNAAQEGPYFGASIGSADDDVFNETDTGLKLFGGYNFNSNLGVEVAYVDLGEYRGGTFEQDGISVEAVGYLPIADNIDVFGKLGMFSWDVSTPTVSDDGNDLTYGLGLNFQMNSQIGVRAEWQNYEDISGGDVSLISDGVSLSF